MELFLLSTISTQKSQNLSSLQTSHQQLVLSQEEVWNNLLGTCNAAVNLNPYSPYPGHIWGLVGD